MRSAMQATGMFFNDPLLAGTFAKTNFTPRWGPCVGHQGGPGGTPMNIPGSSPDPMASGTRTWVPATKPQCRYSKALAIQMRDLFGDTSGGKNTKDPNWFEASHPVRQADSATIGPDSPYQNVDTAVALYNQLAWSIDSSGKPGFQ